MALRLPSGHRVVVVTSDLANPNDVIEGPGKFMAFIPVPNTAKVAMLQQLAGQQVVSTFHVRWDAAPTNTLLDALNTDMISWWNTNLKTHLTPSIALVQVQSTDLTTASGATRINVLSTPSAGTFSDSPLPNNVAIVISHRTGLRGRNYRGRTYVAGTGLTQRADSLSMTQTTISNLLADFGALLTLINVGVRLLVVASRFLNKVPRVTGIVTPITAFTADQAMDSQRRRQLGRGA